MSKESLETLVKNGYSTRQISKILEQPHSTIRRHMKLAGLMSQHKQSNLGIKKPAKECGLCKKLTIRGRKYCQTCIQNIRRFKIRKAAVELFGNRCLKCGWSGHLSGYDFHHKYDKKFKISSIQNKSWKIIKLEIEKCELLCAICHRIKHSNYDDELEIIARSWGGALL